MLLAGFQGACFVCKNKIYRANECPTRDKKDMSIQMKVNKNCIHCGKKGQLAKDFWCQESKKDKRPVNFKPVEDTTALGAVTEEKV
jgi:hypothetical protein